MLLPTGTGGPSAWPGVYSATSATGLSTPTRPIRRACILDTHEGGRLTVIGRSGNDLGDQDMIVLLGGFQDEPHQRGQNTKATKDHCCFQFTPPQPWR